MFLNPFVNQTRGSTIDISATSLTLSGNITLTGGGNIVSTGNGSITILPNGSGITVIGDAGSTSHSLAANDDLFVTGKLEVDGRAYFDDIIYFYSSTIWVDNAQITLGTTNQSILDFSTDQTTQPTLMWGLEDTADSIIFTKFANRNKNHDHAAQTNPTIFVHSAKDPDTANDEWWSITHDVTDAVYSRGSGVHKFDAVIRFASSLYWKTEHIELSSVDPGGSGATWTTMDANTLGGYLIDAAGEYLYFQGDACSDWDGASDIEVKVIFEVNVDNGGGGGTDTVDLSLLSYYKGDGDTVNKTQTVEEATTVGASAQYKQFVATITLNWDETDNIIEIGDKLSFRLNLETDTSEVDNIIINHIHIKYKSAKVGKEV